MQTETRKSYTIRFSDQEKQLIETEAKEAGQNFATYVRMRVTGSSMTEAEQKLEAFAELIDERLSKTLEQSQQAIVRANKVYAALEAKYGRDHG